MFDVKASNERFKVFVRNSVIIEIAVFILLVVLSKSGLGCSGPTCVQASYKIAGFGLLSLYLIAMLLLNIFVVYKRSGNVNKTTLLIYNNLVFVVLLALAYLIAFS